MTDGSSVDHGPERGLALARVAGRDARRLGRELFGERVGHGIDDDDPLGRHADLALVHEGAKGRRLDRLVEIGVLQHDQRRLAAEFEQAGREVLGRAPGDDAADRRAAGEIHALDLRSHWPSG